MSERYECGRPHCNFVCGTEAEMLAHIDGHEPRERPKRTRRAAPEPEPRPEPTREEKADIRDYLLSRGAPTPENIATIERLNADLAQPEDGGERERCCAHGCNYCEPDRFNAPIPRTDVLEEMARDVEEAVGLSRERAAEIAAALRATRPAVSQVEAREKAHARYAEIFEEQVRGPASPDPSGTGQAFLDGKQAGAYAILSIVDAALATPAPREEARSDRQRAADVDVFTSAVERFGGGKRDGEGRIVVDATDIDYGLAEIEKLWQERRRAALASLPASEPLTPNPPQALHLATANNTTSAPSSDGPAPAKPSDEATDALSRTMRQGLTDQE